MSNSAFSVLLPNARRVNVKVTPDTSILQILEDVCEKQQLNANEWDLKHFNRVIELGKSVRFSGLPNNATLELVQSTKPRKESAVNLVLQLDSGKRLTKQFSPQTTLWSILEHWENEGENVFPAASPSSNENSVLLLPVCIYMRQDIVGKEKLQEKTLKSLGLFQGSAVIRLIHRAENQVKHQANVSSVLTPKVTPSPSIPLPTPVTSNPVTQTTKKDPPVDNQQNEQNLMSEKVDSLVDSKELLPTDNEDKKEEEKPKDTISKSDTLSNNGATTMDLDMEAKNNGDIVTPVNESPVVPMEIESTSLEEPSNSINPERQMRAQHGHLNILGEFQALLYHADDVNPRQIQQQPDEFFEVTINDVKSIYRGLQTERKQLEEAPLQTESARLLEQENAIQKNLSTHPITIVRIRFPDRHVLQGTFKTDDSVKIVYDFVRGYLDNPQLNFYLFKTPPKEILSEENTLLESGLVGFAVIYIGSNDGPDKFIKETLLLSDPEEVFKYSPQATKGTAASPTHHHHLSKTRKIEDKQSNEQTQASTSSNTPSSNDQSSSSGSSSSRASASNRPVTTTDAVPKWFKGIGGKKT